MLIGRRSLRLRNELEQEVRRQHWGGLPTEARERGFSCVEIWALRFPGIRIFVRGALNADS